MSPDGVQFSLRCPYDGAELATLPTWMLPACRPARQTACEAATVVAAGGLSEVWGGRATPLLDDMPMNLWRDDAGLHLAAAAGPATIEDTARALARASRSPRYADEHWSRLMDSSSNVDHAWKEADRNEVDRATIDHWREQLLNWHWSRDTTKAARH